MTRTLISIFNLSEIWALIIPLAVLSGKRTQPLYLKPVIVYLWAALFLNTVVDLMSLYNRAHHGIMISNNPVYNIHSLVRFICFSYFFILLRQQYFSRVRHFLPFIYILFVLVRFSKFENFFLPDHISGNLFTVEAFLLLIYCLSFYLAKLNDDVQSFRISKDFWVVTGLSIYVVINFFVFLFYVPMIKENPELANNMWDVHNVAYILLCIFIAKAFYVPAGN